MKKLLSKNAIYKIALDYIENECLDICEFFDSDEIATLVTSLLTGNENMARLGGYVIKLTHYGKKGCKLSVSSFEGTGVADCLVDIIPNKVSSSTEVEYIIGMLNEAYYLI